MTIFLRNEHNNTVADIEVNKKADGQIDVHSVVNIKEFSELLWANKSGPTNGIVDDFENVQNLRRWYWEVYPNSDNPVFHEVVAALKVILIPIAERYDLALIVD